MSLIPVILPTTVAAPTFASILTSQDTYLNSLTPLSVVGSGGGGGYPANANFSTINVSSMITSLALNVSSINVSTITSRSLNVSSINVSTITSPTGVNKIVGSLNMTGGNIDAINAISGISAELTQLYTDSINPKTLATESITIRGLDPVTQANNYLSTLIIDSAVVNISSGNLIVSSINNAPALTLAQYQYLSSIVP